LDNFIYTASHDLRAPISNIEGLVDALDSVLLQSQELPEVKEIIELMRFSVNKFKETIKDLTEISKIQKEKIEDVQEVDVLELLNEIELGIKEVIDSSNAKIELELNESKIRFSKKNLRSIFYNLISNAIKYKAPNRNPYIKIKTERKDGFILFSISDNGLGIPQKHQGKIFTMFKRFHDHVDGTGIGLYIVKRILDNEGGIINVDSQEGKGSTFNVFFKQ
jgi:signal transduction histidine kinase